MTGGLVVIAAVWLVVTGLMARSQLDQVRSEVHELRAQIAAGNLPGARLTAAALASHAHRAHQLTSGPVWAVTAGIPVVGDPAETVRGITANVDALGQDVLPRLVDASEQLDPARLRRPGGRIDLAPIVAAGPGLDVASAGMTHAVDAIGALPRTTWLSPVDSARSDLSGQVAALAHSIRSADLAVRILPTMLGHDGPKRYLVGFENEAEARGTGGLIGAFAIVEADHGLLRFTRFETVALAGVPAHVDFGPDYNQLYAGARTTLHYGNANLSPHFPYAAQILASMWRVKSGEQVDGVVAVDSTALAYLLAATGPAALPDSSLVTAANVVALTQSTAYAKFPSLDEATQLRRRDYLLAISRAVSAKILESHASMSALVRAGGRAAGERRLLVWSADPAVERDLEQTSVAGTIPRTRAPYVGLSIVNDAGNKLDYYLDRSLTWDRRGCGSSRDVTVTITLTNNAPASGLSPYVTYRSDRHAYPVEPGDNRLEVSYLATQGALMNAVTVGGVPTTAGAGIEHGHPLYTVDLELPRATTRTIVLHLTEPVGTGKPVVLRQPLVRPLAVTVKDSSCD